MQPRRHAPSEPLASPHRRGGAALARSLTVLILALLAPERPASADAPGGAASDPVATCTAHGVEPTAPTDPAGAVAAAAVAIVERHDGDDPIASTQGAAAEPAGRDGRRGVATWAQVTPSGARAAAVRTRAPPPRS